MDNLQLSLEDMGFSKSRAEKALRETGNKSLEDAMDWLIEHEDDPDADVEMSVDTTPFSTAQKPVPQPISPVEESTVEIVFDSTRPSEHITGSASVAPKPDSTSSSSAANTSVTPKPQQISPPPASVAASVVEESLIPHSYKCDECGKLFKNEDEVQFHAAKSNHSQFSESTEVVKALSEDERKQRLQDLQERLKAKREQTEAEEKRKLKEMELNRRKAGQDFQAARQRIEEEEMKKIAEDRKRQKREDQLAKQRVLDQIKLDRESQKRELKSDPSASPTSKETVGAVASASGNIVQATSSSQPAKNYEETKINIRLLNGNVMTQSFKVNETLSAVRLYVEMNRTDEDVPFNLMTSYPKRVFTDDDMEMPLKHLGLVPTAVLTLTKKA